MRYLALILFLPAFAILGWLYWKFPRALPASRRRRLFDVAALSLAFAATALSIGWAIPEGALAVEPGTVANQAGPMWKQILGTLAAWHVYPLVLAVAWRVRARLFAR